MTTVFPLSFDWFDHTSKMNCPCPFWLDRVITLVLVLQHSIKNTFIDDDKFDLP